MPPSQELPRRYRALVGDALAALGVRRLVFSIHDASFPADPSEDVGRGSPHGDAAARLLRFVHALGFTGVQLGPQGRTTPDNPSPYDGAVFSRSVASIAVRALAPGGPEAGLVDSDLVERALCTGTPSAVDRSDHRRASAAIDTVLAEAFRRFEQNRSSPMTERFHGFRKEHAVWLERDALYDALRTSHHGAGFRHWTRDGAPDPARDLWDPAPGAEEAAAALRGALVTAFHREIAHYAFNQWIAHEQHARFRAFTAGLGLALYGDFQVGMSDGDAWSARGLFLRAYAMGAPPSRTNPDGQPWNYPVPDPAKLRPSPATGGPGAGLAFLLARLDKAFSEYDGLRIDHPHGLVCPWVYRTDGPDSGLAVLNGARLYSAPDLPEHPVLAPFAIARPEQLDRSLPRWADGWVSTLDPEQVARYALVFDAIVDSARRRGRSPSDLVCEVLSTMPRPLGLVLERHGLGRFRVLQKADLDDPADVYRTENARRNDWVMLGNHDTAPVWRLLDRWDARLLERWCRHLATRLALAPDEARRLRREPGFVAQAMLAELFACPAENLMIFFTDLFGMTDVYNVPGTISDDNWSLRLPADFEALYAERVARGAALNLPLALSLALRARGGPFAAAHAELARALGELGHRLDCAT